ncbi:hypothetical protein HPHPP30_0305 [Helicobacter pylori Hp P-30]|nr:hypothetical protein HPHPP30_0305 [Helicobacter pylori Hp P-30]
MLLRASGSCDIVIALASNKLEPLKGVWSLYSQFQALSKSKAC